MYLRFPLCTSLREIISKPHTSSASSSRAIEDPTGTLPSDIGVAYHSPLEPQAFRRLRQPHSYLLSISNQVTTILRVQYAGRQGQCGNPPWWIIQFVVHALVVTDRGGVCHIIARTTSSDKHFRLYDTGDGRRFFYRPLTPLPQVALYSPCNCFFFIT